MSDIGESAQTSAPQTPSATSAVISSPAPPATSSSAGKDGGDAAAATPNTPGPKTVKQKVAVCFGYVGERYCGLQYVKEDGIPTVEKTLLRAFHQSGVLTDANVLCDHPLQKNSWERASRTDKGVHALKNIISVRMTFDERFIMSGEEAAACFGPAHTGHAHTQQETPLFVDFVKATAAINAELPADIRVFRVQPVTGSFNAYQMCVGRRYQYYLPTFALMSPEEFIAAMPLSVAPAVISDEAIAAELTEVTEDPEPRGTRPGSKRSRDEDADGADERNVGEHMNIFRTIPADRMRCLAAYRITPEGLERTRRLFQIYVGTKGFHNFTPGGKASDRSTMRFIQSIVVNDPEVLSPDLTDNEASGVTPEQRARVASTYAGGVEWVRIEIEGQSFMLNQIRKMVGLVISAMTLGLPDVFVADTLLTCVSRGVPMAPANGLFLSCLDFNRYNQRLTRIQGEGNQCGTKETVDVDAEAKAAPSTATAYERAQLQAMRTAVADMHKAIVATVCRREACEDITGRWMRSERNCCRLSYRMDFSPTTKYPEAYEPVKQESLIKSRTPVAPTVPVETAAGN